jgi:hypothetical protein
MVLALRGERLWNYCSSGTDPSNFFEYAMAMPVPADASTVTDAEKEKIFDWIAKDAQAKVIINRKISPVIASQLDRSWNARQQWDLLALRYSRSDSDVLSIYELRRTIRSEKLKGAEDISRYVSVFEDARRRFLQMGDFYPDLHAIFDLLEGLPSGVEWEVYRVMTTKQVADSMYSVQIQVVTPPASSSSSTSPSTTAQGAAPSIPGSVCLSGISFETIITSLTEHAHSIAGRRRLARPGSEYANAAVFGGSKDGVKTNPTTGVRIHPKNPKGIRCVNISCADKPRADTHDIGHCHWPGGGMEDQVPADGFVTVPEKKVWRPRRFQT